MDVVFFVVELFVETQVIQLLLVVIFVGISDALVVLVLV